MRKDPRWTPQRRRVLATLLAGAALPVLAQVSRVPEDRPDDSPRWQALRRDVFGERAPRWPADDLIRLEAPTRADDGAVVPIAIRVLQPQRPERYVRRIVLVIDQNPSPAGAVFHFTPASGRAEVETRVRIDDYTHVRAIAEMNDGSLHMAVRHVKASGGCSAPPGKDPQAALATLGRMKMQVVGPLVDGQPAQAQLMVSHPNHSGMAMDQVTRLYTPAHFVRRVEVTYAGQLVFAADVDFTISENPHFRFDFVPRGSDGELRAVVVDTEDKTFVATLPVRPSP